MYLNTQNNQTASNSNNYNWLCEPHTGVWWPGPLEELRWSAPSGPPSVPRSSSQIQSPPWYPNYQARPRCPPGHQKSWSPTATCCTLELLETNYFVIKKAQDPRVRQNGLNLFINETENSITTFDHTWRIVWQNDVALALNTILLEHWEQLSTNCTTSVGTVKDLTRYKIQWQNLFIYGIRSNYQFLTQPTSSRLDRRNGQSHLWIKFISE